VISFLAVLGICFVGFEVVCLRRLLLKSHCWEIDGIDKLVVLMRLYNEK
jgi:hypothetical protein